MAAEVVGVRILSGINQPFFRGMSGFTIVWLGQLLSMLGSGMTRFALTIWAWEITGSATALALVGFFGFGSLIVMTPFAGALVDRWNRKLVMMLSDLATSLSTVVVLVLHLSGNLEVWHLCILVAFAGAFEAFQFPAYSTAVSVMVEPKDYARANGLLSTAESGAGIFAPMLGALLLSQVGIAGILFIDIATLVFALTLLLLVQVPTTLTQKTEQSERTSLLKDAGFGFQYILQNPSLMWLQSVFLLVNLVGTFGMVVTAPMILARTGNDEVALGLVQSAIAVGGLVGAIVLSSWGGPRRKIHGVLIGMILSGLLGQTIMGLGQATWVWIAGGVGFAFFIPILNGCNQAIWQSKVPVDIQGRVFAARRLIAQVAAPIAMLAAGPLADYLFEPAMQPGAALAAILGGVFGTGPGAGMALLLSLSGIASALVGLGAYAFRPIRDVESILLDHSGATEGASAAIE